MSNKEALGRVILEASAGQHGAVAAQLATAWTEMANEHERLKAGIVEGPLKNYINMGAQALAAELIEAVTKDEQGEGLDISAGLFGTHTSAWLRSIASSYLSQPATSQEAPELGAPLNGMTKKQVRAWLEKRKANRSTPQPAQQANGEHK